MPTTFGLPALGEEKPEEELMGKVYYSHSMYKPEDKYSMIFIKNVIVCFKLVLNMLEL